MTYREVLEAVAAVAENVGPAASPDPSQQLSLSRLPVAHQRLLSRVNGFTVYSGAYRMFGVHDRPPLSLAWWNSSGTWRFAWADRAEGYLFFGGTAWGDQYAYRTTASGTVEPAIYFLEASLLKPEIIAQSFEEFAGSELLRNARRPYDELTLQAVARLGPIPPELNWAFAPSITLGEWRTSTMSKRFLPNRR